VRGKFSSPLLSRRSDDEDSIKKEFGYYNSGNPCAKNPGDQKAGSSSASSNPLLEDDRLKGLDPKLIELVSNEAILST